MIFSSLIFLFLYLPFVLIIYLLLVEEGTAEPFPGIGEPLLLRLGRRAYVRLCLSPTSLQLCLRLCIERLRQTPWCPADYLFCRPFQCLTTGLLKYANFFGRQY